MLVAGAPVTNRPWAMADWFQCLAEQTRPPDAVALLWTSSGPHCEGRDETWSEIVSASRDTGLPVHILQDKTHPKPRHDNDRFELLAGLRNNLLAFARVSVGATRFLSLDTDIMLEQDDSIERLQVHLDAGFDFASGLCFFHPLGRDSYAINAGRWSHGGLGDSFTRGWHRPKFTRGDVLPIDVPMGIVLMNEAMLTGARYGLHESGEDIAMGLSLERLGMAGVWDTRVEGYHCWDEPAHALWARERAAV